MLSGILLANEPHPTTLADLNDVSWLERVVAGCELTIDPYSALFDEPPRLAVRPGQATYHHSLDQAQLSRIVEIQLKRLEKRLAQQNLALTLDNAAKKFLAQEGFDPQFGARPLKRAIQEELLDPLSLKLLDGEFKPGDRIRVTAADNELIFQNGEKTTAKSSG